MRSRVVGLVLVGAVVCALAGCGDDEPGGPGGASTSPSRSPGDASASASSTPSGPSVTPATGPLVETDVFDLRLFEADDWTSDRLGSAYTASTSTEVGLVQVTITTLATTETDLEADARIVLDLAQSETPRPERAENRTIDGVECWVLAGADDEDRTYTVGGLHAGHQFAISFDLPAELEGAEERIEQVLASIEWR